MDNIKPVVSIVILNWNSADFIHKCIESVLNQHYKKYEVIFVDNCSNNSSLIDCKKRYPNFRYIENKENLGFAAGMNIGIRECQGKYVLLLNTDVYLEDTFLEKTVSLLEENPEVSCTACDEYKWDYPVLTNRKVGNGGLGIALHLRIKGTEPKGKYTFGVSGSYPLFRKETIDEIIGFRGFFYDEKFGTGWEDTELRFLFAFMDKKTMLCKGTRAWHIGSAADNGNVGMFDKSLSYQQRIFRNRMYVIGKFIKGNYMLWYWYICTFNFIIYLYVKIAHKESVPSLKAAIKEYNASESIIKKENTLIRKSIKINKRDIYKFIISF